VNDRTLINCFFNNYYIDNELFEAYLK